MLAQDCCSDSEIPGSVDKTEHTPYRIMICEDELIVASDIQQSLEEFGYTVVGIAATGIEAIEMAKDFRPDLALMDIQLLGDMNGIEVAQVIGDRFDIPVIYLSAFANPQIVEKATVTEPLAYLVKPYSEHELRSAVEIGIVRHRKHQTLKREIKECHSKLNQQNDNPAVADRVMELHRELMELEKMEALQMMAGGLAHHLNNALAVIQGNVELLMEEESLGREASKMAKLAALASCERVSWIVKQFLWFSEHGNHCVSSALASEIVSEAISEVSPLLCKGVEVVDNLPTNPFRIMVDKQQVKRALVNLIFNAQDATLGDGTVSIGATEIYEPYPERLNSATKPGWFVGVSVTDWGTGIKEGDLHKITDPFYTTKRLGDGLGLGLATAYGVVHRHGGWLDFKSQEGRGTTVTMYLPQVGGSEPVNAVRNQ